MSRIDSRALVIAVAIAACVALAAFGVWLLSRDKGPRNDDTVRAGGGQVEPAGHAGRFRVATYNVNWANRDLSKVTDAVIKSKAGIVAFQEITPRSASHLKATLEKEFPYIVFHGYKDRGDSYGFGFIYGMLKK